MAVDLSELMPSPSRLRRGTTKVEMSYEVVVNSAADNPVSLTLHIDPKSPVFFIDENGDRQKSITRRETINASALVYTWETEIEITETPPRPVSCNLRIAVTDDIT